MEKEKVKQKFKITRSYIGKPEDKERLVEIARRLLRLDEEQPREKAA
jgi:hypothetical protein